MTPELKSFLISLTDIIRQQAEALAEAAGKIPKLDAALVQRLEKAAADLQALSLPTSVKPRAGHEARSLELRPYLAEYANEPPKQVSYHELAGLLSLGEASIRVRISQSVNKGFVRYAQGRFFAIVRDPSKLQQVLDEKFTLTGHPDDRVVLPKRPPKTR